MPAFTGDAAAAIASDSCRLAIFWRLASDPPARFWSGPGAYELPPDTVETEGGAYVGGGRIGELPVISQLINGVAERVEFALSGVDAVIFAQFDAESEQLCEKEVRLGIVVLDADWQPVSDCFWLWTAVSDSTDCDWAGGQRVISLSAGSAMTGRARSALVFYSDAHQQRRSPGDRFCERTQRYRLGSVKAWPRF